MALNFHKRLSFEQYLITRLDFVMITLSNGILDLSKLDENERAMYDRLRPRWRQIYARCENPKASGYEIYGAKGVSMCAEWRDKKRGFARFFVWMIEHGYSLDCKLSVDRIDGEGDYSPSNCRLATSKEQNNNSKRARRFASRFHKGPARTISEWAELVGVTRNTIMRRLAHGVDVGTMVESFEQMEFQW